MWDEDRKASAWSEIATFGTGLLTEADWQGKWIGADKDVSARLMRREFELTGPVKRARAYVSGLG